MSEDYMIQLETLVDRYGIADVLHTLMKICDAKAEHLAVNWQNARAAKQWAKYADQIQKVKVSQ